MIHLAPYDESDRTLYRDRVIRFVRQFQIEEHRSPFQREIAAGTGIASHGSVWRALKVLEKEGRIRRCRTQISILPPD